MGKIFKLWDTEGMEEIFDTAVVGGGIAGYEAALVLKNLRRSVLWIGTTPLGEKLPAAEFVRNFPGFSGSGTDLYELLSAQMEKEALSFTKGRIDGIYASDGKFLLTQNNTVYTARTVILATGVETRGNLKGEENFLGRGVSYCAVCDGALYRGKTIAAVLSSKEFEEEAEYLAGFADRVYCFCAYPNPVFRARNIKRMEGLPIAVEGNARAERLIVAEGELAIDGVFLLKNSAPPAALVGGLQVENGCVKVERNMSTNLPGLFAAGDVTGRPYQYAKAAGEGLVAAFSAHEYLNAASAHSSAHSSAQAGK